MTEYKVNGLKAFAKLFAVHQTNRQARLVGAARKAAHKTRSYIDRNTIPVAFDELRGSGKVELHKQGAKVSYDARHAAAVEEGSRPHWVPIAPLIAWVKLRGMQGLRSERQLARASGTTTAHHARTVAAQLREHMLTDGSDAIAVDAPERVARAIQAAIAKRGTKPHWFARKALPAARAYVAELMTAALRDPTPEA